MKVSKEDEEHFSSYNSCLHGCNQFTLSTSHNSNFPGVCWIKTVDGRHFGTVRADDPNTDEREDIHSFVFDQDCKDKILRAEGSKTN